MSGLENARPAEETPRRRRIAILGYGRLGRFLAERITGDAAVSAALELAFVWNRSPAAFADGETDARFVSGDVDACLAQRLEAGGVDLIVEACHPDIVGRIGARVLEHADLLVTSVTALVGGRAASALTEQAERHRHALYVPTGAGWGVQDIAKLDRAGRLEGLSVSMEFHADSLRLEGRLADDLQAYRADPAARDAHLLYEGPLRALAALAPNNVNTMACLWLAAASLPPDAMVCRLIARKEGHAHAQLIEVRGPDGFRVETRRHNPGPKSAVTGNETLNAFLASLLNTGDASPGLHFC